MGLVSKDSPEREAFNDGLSSRWFVQTKENTPAEGAVAADDDRNLQNDGSLHLVDENG